MKREWAAYSPDAESIATQFAAGVNAYIRWLAAHPQQMPYEFKLLHYQPGLWSPEDVVRIRSHGLGGNLLQGGGTRRGGMRRRLEGRRNPSASGAALANRQLPRLGSVFAEKCTKSLFPGHSSSEALTRRTGWQLHLWQRPILKRRTLRLTEATTGSSARKNPLPGEPSWPVIRIATMCSPAFVICRTSTPRHCTSRAWASPLSGSLLRPQRLDRLCRNRLLDRSEDLYVYQLNPANPEEYKYQGKWEAFRTVHEEIKVKGQSQSRRK